MLQPVMPPPMTTTRARSNASLPRSRTVVGRSVVRSAPRLSYSEDSDKDRHTATVSSWSGGTTTLYSRFRWAAKK